MHCHNGALTYMLLTCWMSCSIWFGRPNLFIESFMRLLLHGTRSLHVSKCLWKTSADAYNLYEKSVREGRLMFASTIYTSVIDDWFVATKRRVRSKTDKCVAYKTQRYRQSAFCLHSTYPYQVCWRPLCSRSYAGYTHFLPPIIFSLTVPVVFLLNFH